MTRPAPFRRLLNNLADVNVPVTSHSRAANMQRSHQAITNRPTKRESVKIADKRARYKLRSNVQ